MNRSEILEKVKQVFVNEFEIEDEIREDSLIFSELGLDSLDSVDLIVALEKMFAFKIDRSVDGEKISKIKSICDVADFVELKTK